MLVVLIAASIAIPVFAQQAHFEHLDNSAPYGFEWPIKEVAVIGAGVSGLLSYRALSDKHHFDRIRIFERDENPGGNWHYSDEHAATVPIASGLGCDWWKADYTANIPSQIPFHKVYKAGSNESLRDEFEKNRINHRQPKPLWQSLRANTPAPQQQVPGFSWPFGVEWASHHSKVQRYLRSFASWLGINNGDQSTDVSYNTRVELVSKRLDNKGRQTGWTLVLRKYVQTYQGVYVEQYWEEASATGISLDINTFAKTSYLSVREHSNDPRAPIRREAHLSSVAGNTTMIGEIKAFHPIPKHGNMSTGEIELLNGTIIFGTGFRYAFPFLPQYHNSSVSGNEPADSEEQPIVTDGSHVRSLYLDTFYIDQPTLAFQGQNVGIQTFIYGKYAGEAIARVWSGKAHLPSAQAQWRHFWKTVEERGGLKKGFQWLDNELNSRSLNYFVAWLNAAAIENGEKLLELPPDVTDVMDVWMKARAAGVSVNPDGRNDLQEIDHVQHQWRAAIRDDW
ncbi:uncharacterized protein IL334_006893 [Kwoniella shivajii]|uniref:FAD/NAD(P)-binding domain-containing protein n=1 Tax=Kwoniella shivajii TaxID=564305 RepID=A0ABZ1D8I1_9TREE|nr:hypothetical protein IL334_006893 [Kwoniella shivajii]